MDELVLNGITYEGVSALKARLNVKETCLWTWIKKGMPEPLKIGNRRFFDRVAVDKWLIDNAH